MRLICNKLWILTSETKCESHSWVATFLKNKKILSLFKPHNKLKRIKRYHRLKRSILDLTESKKVRDA